MQVIHLSLICRHAHKSHVLIVALWGVNGAVSCAESILPTSSSSSSARHPPSPSPLTLYTPTARRKQVPTEDASISLAKLSQEWMVAGARGREREKEQREKEKEQEDATVLSPQHPDGALS